MDNEPKYKPPLTDKVPVPQYGWGLKGAWWHFMLEMKVGESALIEKARIGAIRVGISYHRKHYPEDTKRWVTRKVDEENFRVWRRT